MHDQHTLASMGAATELSAWTEVELRPGPGAPVEEIEQRLVEAGLRPAEPAAESELDRLLRPAPRVRRAGPAGSAGAALVEYLATHADRLAAEELRVRRGEPDSVHQLRVASRRMRSALQAFRPLLDRDRTDPVVADLREFGRELAPARDAEVLNERIRPALAALRTGAAARPGPGPGHPALRAGRGGSRSGRAEHTGRERYARLRACPGGAGRRPAADQAGAAGRRPPSCPGRWPGPRGGWRARSCMAIDPEQDAERARPRRARRPQGRQAAALRHRGGPAGRRAADAKRFAKALKGFQTALGEHQDTVVAREALRELGAQAHAAGENGFSFGVLHARDAALAARIEEQLPELWADGLDPRNRRWLLTRPAGPARRGSLNRGRGRSGRVCGPGRRRGGRSGRATIAA